jgi:hypothetical protein
MIITRGVLGVLVLILGSTCSRGDDPKFVAVAPGDDGFNEARTTPGYKAAYGKARDEANSSLDDGRSRLLSYGMLGISDLDPETGLGVMPIAGCVVSQEVLGRVEGNNHRVRAWVKEHGPAPNALIRWKDELSDLPVFFAGREKAGATIPLQIGGPPLASPDGRFSLRQVATHVRRGTPPDLRTVTTIGLEVSERGAVRAVLTDELGDGLTDLAWGPPGAPFAVVKNREDGGPAFQILHLRPVDWVIARELSWQRYQREHPEDQPDPPRPE